MYILGQIHDNLINPIKEDYYETIYEIHKSDGYIKPSEFWELPLWAGKLTAILNHNNLDCSLQIFNGETTINEPGEIFFSVLEVNKNFILDIIKANPNRIFYLGGYTNKNYFSTVKNCIWFDSLKEFCSYKNIEFIDNVNWNLFKKFETIPRITLSEGCKHHCKFCIIPNKITVESLSSVMQQIEALKVLSFKLIYLNDKTFGQAENYKLLKIISKKIKSFNPKFNGFIVQTTTGQINKIDFTGLNIFAVELGVETYNNNILKELKKPSNIKLIDNAMSKLKKLNINIIPNLVVGFIQETKTTYSNTYNWLLNNFNNIYHLNIYNLAIYENAEISNEIKSTNKNDTNELSTDKSYNSYEKNELNKKILNKIYNLYTVEHLKLQS